MDIKLFMYYPYEYCAFTTERQNTLQTRTGATNSKKEKVPRVGVGKFECASFLNLEKTQKS